MQVKYNYRPSVSSSASIVKLNVRTVASLSQRQRQSSLPQKINRKDFFFSQLSEDFFGGAPKSNIHSSPTSNESVWCQTFFGCLYAPLSLTGLCCSGLFRRCCKGFFLERRRLCCCLHTSRQLPKITLFPSSFSHFFDGSPPPPPPDARL